MRATELLIAIGAGLGFASAGLVCKTKPLHDAEQFIAETANKEFKESIQVLCSKSYAEGFNEYHFGSIALGLNRTCSNCQSNDFCAEQFDSVINKCVAGHKVAGGIARVDGITASVFIDPSRSETGQVKTGDVRRTSMSRMAKRARKSRPKPAKPKPAKPNPKPKTPTVKPEAKPKPAAPTPKPEQKAKPEKTKTISGSKKQEKTKTTSGSKKPTKTPDPKEENPKACPARRKTSEKEKALGKNKTPGKEKTPGKKGPKNALRSVFSKLFPRVTTPPPEHKSKGKTKEDSPNTKAEKEKAKIFFNDDCLDPHMKQPAGWGTEIFFGYTDYYDDKEYGGKPMTEEILYKIARNAWDSLHRLPPRYILLVAALYVPDKGVFLGTIPTKESGSEDRFKEEVEKFTALWDLIKDRELTHGKSLYHAEDAAMWYAFHKGAVKANSKFPKGSMMVTFGEKGFKGSGADRRPACTGKAVMPHCKSVLRWMEINT